MGTIAENMQVVPAIIPIDLAAGGNNGDWVSLKLFQHCDIVFFADAGTAAQDPILNLNQATAVDGTGSKTLAVITDIWEKEGSTALSAIGSWTHQTQTAAASYTSGTGGENEQLIIIPVDAADLDITANFDCIQLTVADTGATVGKFGCALYILTSPRHASSLQLSAIVD